MMNAEQYRKYEQAVEHNLAGLVAVSTGACDGCKECGLDQVCPHCDGECIDIKKSEGDCPRCNGKGMIEHTQNEIELAGEPSFSWESCDSCGSTLGGDRHPAHALDKNGDMVHLSVCTDCLYYLNYGQLDDMTMMEIQG